MGAREQHAPRARGVAVAGAAAHHGPAVGAVAHLDVAHPIEAATEGLGPQRLGGEAVRSAAPQAHERAAATRGQDAGRTFRGREGHGLVEHVAVGVGDDLGDPLAPTARQDLEARRLRHRVAAVVVLGEVAVGQHQAIRQVGGQRQRVGGRLHLARPGVRGGRGRRGRLGHGSAGPGGGGLVAPAAAQERAATHQEEAHRVDEGRAGACEGRMGEGKDVG